MYNILYNYKGTEGNYYYPVMLHKTQHSIGGATFSPPQLHRMLTNVSYPRGSFLE